MKNQIMYTFSHCFNLSHIYSKVVEAEQIA